MSEVYQETWRPVLGYEGFYSVSSLSKIRQDAKRKNARVGAILAQKRTKWGYLSILLSRSGTRRTIFVHRIVAEAFLGPCPDGLQVNHKNGIKTDNRPENLEYVSPSQNTRHAYDVLGHKASCGESHYRTKLTNENVVEIRALADKGIKQSVIAKKFNMDQSNVSLIVSKKTWSHI